MTDRYRRAILGPLALALALALVGVGPARGQEPSDSDLSLALEGPDQTPLAGEAFEVSLLVANGGPAESPDTHLSLSMSDGAAFGSAVSGDPSDVCTFYDYSDPAPQGDPAAGGGSVAPSGGWGSLECDLGTLASGATTTVTVSLTRTNARELWGSAWVGGTNNDPVYEDNFGDLFIAADTSKPADVALAKSSPKNPDVNSSFDYVLTVRNSGPSTAEDVVVTDQFPDGLQFVSATTGCEYHEDAAAEPQPLPSASQPTYYGYREVVCSLGSIPAGGSRAVTITATRTSPWEIYNNAWVSITNYDDNYDNDYAYAAIAADPSITSDLALKLERPEEAPLVGDAFALSFRATNGGPSQANDVGLSAYFSDGLDVVSVSSSDAGDECDAVTSPSPEPLDGGASSSEPSVSPAYGGSHGFSCSLGSVVVGEATVIDVTLTRTAARDVWGSASLFSSSFDPGYEDNYADLHLGPDTSHPADVSVTKTAPEDPAVGTDFDYEIVATNDGPDVAADVVVTDFLPAEVEFRAATSTDPADSCVVNEYGFSEQEGPRPAEPSSYPYAAYREVVCSLGSLDPGESATLTLSVTRLEAWEIWNSAWVATSSYDPTYDNDYAHAVVNGEPYPGACANEEIDPASGDCTVETGAGPDVVEVKAGSEMGDVTVGSGAAGDSIVVSLGASTTPRTIEVHAGRGPDVITIAALPGAANATVLVYAGRGRDAVTVDLPSGLSEVRVALRGGDGADTFSTLSTIDTAGPMTPLRIVGGARRDVIFGGIGNDVLLGGAGADVINGGPGRDRLVGGTGRDTCLGGPGRDTHTRC